MIAYVDCLSTQPAVNCWNWTYYEDQEELLPLYTPKLSNLQPKNGGSLRRRLLISKIQQQQGALWRPRHCDDPTTSKGSQKQQSSTFRPTSQECSGRPVSDAGHSTQNHVFITAVSSLDEECKWSVHYTAPWHQQENVFLPGSRPPCVEELHHQAKVNLKTVLRECDKLRKDGFRSSPCYSQSPMLSSPVHDGSQDQKEMEKGKKFSRVLGYLSESCISLCCHLKPWRKKSSDSSAEKDKLLYSMGPQTPLVESICDINSLSNWSTCSPLPTPEEKMRQQALSVATDIVPINITGENFDRQASFRRTLINTDTVIRRSKRIKRRKTITGLPDNIQRELGTTEQSGMRSQSMYMPDQHATLGRVGSVNSTLKNSLTCDSGCQTEEVKILPPSMRRIRAQKGHGIAVQLANISLSSSGSMSTMSDYSAAVYTPQFNNTEQGFHSLPRQGARNSVQQLEPKCSNYLYQIGSTSSLPSKVNIHHPSPNSQFTCVSQKAAPISPKSEDFQGFQAEHKATGYGVSDHNNCPAFLSNCATQQNSRNIAHGAQNLYKEEIPLEPVSPCSSEQPFGSPAASFSAGSSCCHSSVSLHMATHTDTESHCSTLDGSTCNSHSCDISESCSTPITDHWTCEPTSKDQHASSCSSPVSHSYNSLERLPSKSDSSSLFSPDSEGYYTSMHLESGLKSYSHGCINKASKARDDLYECRAHHSQDDSVSLHSNQSLTRSISLRKAKKPPLPPRRTDSLQRKSQRKPHHNDNVFNNEQLISSLHESLTSHSELLSAQMPISGFEDPWVLRPRSHSTISAASSGMSAPAAVCPVTPTHSDSSSQHSEYTELCDVHPECLHSGAEQRPSFSIPRSKQAEENSRQVKNIPSKDCNRSEVNSVMAASPEKIHIVTSPSSGYSSQSITPTLGTPVVSLLRAKSPAGRLKPKVPERKSSLRSSVSSSCTSLSSNTSDSTKNLPTPPPISKTLAGVLPPQSASASPTSNSVTTSKTEQTIPPPSPLTVSPNTEIKQSSAPVSPTTKDGSKSSFSLAPALYDLPSVVSEPVLLTESEKSPLPLLSPSTFALVLPSNIHNQSPPPSPGTHLQPFTSLKTTDLRIVETTQREKESYFRHREKPEKHEKPLITAQALQMVQLRPIKLMNLENIFTDIITTVCDRADKEQDLEPGTSSNKSDKTEILENWGFFDSASPLQDEIHALESLECPVKAITHNMLSSHPPSAICEAISSTKSGENIEHFPIDYELLEIPSASLDILKSTASPVYTLHNEKPPISPKLSVKMSPILNQPALSGLEPFGVTDSAVSSEPDVLNGTSLLDSVDLQEILLQLELEQLQLELEDSSLSFPAGPSENSLRSEILPRDSQLTVLTLTEHETGTIANDHELINKDLDDKGISVDNSSGSVIFKEEEDDEDDAVFNSSTDSSSSSTNGETIEEMMTPLRPRTTEDLFAAIHRSKRKVLGRCDSEEERSWGFLPSPPVAPTSSCPIMPSIPRQNSFIQRGLRRSSTSSNSFKALLLKKGSRSDPGFRMSATEMLKCTDPRLQRANVEPLPSFPSPCASPVINRRASEDWARTEGVLPRLSPFLTPSKYGRSSTPPSAASSRYNSRSRISSGPMTVICEREGELAESTDCCLDVDIPFDASLTASGMVCAQGST